jgi:hypothetical protein
MSVLAHCREVMGEEDRIENLEKERNHSLWEIPQGPVRARSLAVLEAFDGFMNILRVG